jgi:hypothetical protein
VRGAQINYSTPDFFNPLRVAKTKSLSISLFEREMPVSTLLFIRYPRLSENAPGVHPNPDLPPSRGKGRDVRNPAGIII